MVAFEIKGVSLNSLSFEDAKKLVFHETLLQKIYGPDIEVGQWKDGQRTLKMVMDIPSNVPYELVRFFCGNKIVVTVKQKIKISNKNLHEVKSRVHMHVFGDDLWKIRPRWTIRMDPRGKPFLDTCVEVSTLLPPPLRQIMERFLLENAENDLRKYVATIVSELA